MTGREKMIEGLRQGGASEENIKIATDAYDKAMGGREETCQEYKARRLDSRDREPGELWMPAIGAGATVHYGSDSYPFTIIKKTANTVTIQADRYERIDSRGPYTESQDYRYFPDPEGRIMVVRWTKRGWRANGTPVSMTGRRAYRDPSF